MTDTTTALEAAREAILTYGDACYRNEHPDECVLLFNAAWALVEDALAHQEQRAEPVAHKSLSAAVADSLRPYLGDGQKVIWQDAFRWKDDNGVMPNHYEMWDIRTLADEFGYEVIHDCGCAGVIRPAAPQPPKD